MRRPGRAHDSSEGARRPGTVGKDSLFRGEVTLFQPTRGYRVNVDSLILGHFAATERPEAKRLVDLGAGVGAVTLATARFGHVRHATLVEKESSLAELAERNLAHANLAGEVFTADLARGLPRVIASSADVVVANPPFFAESHSASPSPEKRGARAGAVEPFFRAAKVALGRRGYAFFVYPAERLEEFLSAATRTGLVAKKLRFVHAFAESPARVVLAELRAAKPGGLVVLPPLVEWARKGVRTDALSTIVDGRATPRSVNPRRAVDRG